MLRPFFERVAFLDGDDMVHVGRAERGVRNRNILRS